MIRYQTCPACKSSNTEFIGKPYGCNEDSKFSVIKCSECGLEWCDPMPTKKELDDYYNSYYEKRYSTVDKNPAITKIRSILTFRHIRLTSFFNLIKKYSPENSILDFGCGEAQILYLAKKNKWKVLGLDYSNELKDTFEKAGIDFYHGNDLDETAVPENSFGCISAKHVVEHLPDLPNFLQSVRRCLTKDGIFAVKTPSATSLRAKLGLANWHLVRPMEHFWGFNKDNFRILMEENGFQVLSLEDNLFVDELTCIARIKQD
jgi:SAM-dependent methyltransferase